MEEAAAAGADDGTARLAELRERGWEAKRAGQYGQMRDAFAMAVREAEVLHDAAEPWSHEKSWKRLTLSENPPLTWRAAD